MRLRNIFSAMLLAVISLTSAAQDMMQPLPVDPDVRVGQLGNGLTYYIRHNEEPKGQAFFYIAQKVGSIQEEESQRGLAHFLEHMCFNGTTHFPDSTLIEYLGSIGVKFGAQLNAYTSVEETVYNIDNVPVREGTIDSCLLILHDWSHDLSLDGNEIDKERGVIHSEWRMRNSGYVRILVRNLEKLMSDSRYGRRFPIGLMEVVDGCPYDTLRAYYHRWYRPDLQGIIVVGDIDVNQIEAKIQALFSPIELPAERSERVYYSVPDNNEAIVVSDKDSEVTTQDIMISMKHEAIPDSIRNTIPIYVAETMIRLTTDIINQRLNELSLKPECSFKSAVVYDGSFLLSSKVTGAFNIDINPKEGRTEEAIRDVLAEVYRADINGFTKGEIDRATAELMANMDQLFNNRDKQKSINYAHEYYRSFLNNEAIPGIAVERQLLQMILPQIPTEAYNQTFQELVSRTDTNLVVLALSPDKEGLEIPTEQSLLDAIHAAQQMQLEAWVDNVKTGPLIESLPQPGTVTKEENGPFDTRILTLSNGVKVVMKQTDFKDDEIRMSAWSEGGTGSYSSDEYLTLEVMDDVLGQTCLGGFTQTELTKALAGKVASVGANITSRTEGLGGSSSIRNQRTMFELIYMYFQPRQKDNDAFGAFKESLREELRNKDLNPLASLSDSIQATIFNHHKLTTPIKESDVDNIDYDRILEIYADRFADASDFTFLFVGNVDYDSIRTLSCQYLATLPTVQREDKAVDNGLHFYTQSVTNRYEKKMETPQSFAIVAWTAPIEQTVKNDAIVSILGQCVSEIYLKKIREELSAAYTASASASIMRGSDDQPRYLIQGVAPLKPEMTDTALVIMHQTMVDIANNGPAAESITKAKEFMVKTFQQNLRENGFWQGRIRSIMEKDYDSAADYEAIVNGITAADIQAFAQQVVRDNNCATIVMMPSEMEDQPEAAPAAQ
ncbi:MAG: insulinase family protein [Bacteroidaceae bacterium]|nr:insulinase family protein [Bacteroidaceae bacterium]